MDNLDKIIGFVTLGLSVASRFIGFPHQIKKIRQTKNVESVSLPFFGIAFFACLAWVAHGIIIKDWVTIIGQGIGTISCGIVIILILKYRNTNHKNQ